MPAHGSVSAAAGCERPVRVLVTTPLLTGKGGVSQYLSALRPHLRNDVQYLTIGSRSGEEKIQTTLLRMVQDSWRFARTLIQGEFDIVHLNPSIFPKALVRDGILLLIAKALGKEVLVFTHGWNPAWDGRPPMCLRWGFRFVYRHADAFIVLGNRFKQRLQLFGYDKRIFVEGAPVADELLNDCEAEPPERSPTTGDRFNILFLARVEKDKGIYETLDAYLRVKQNFPATSLTVAGEGSELDAARRYASSRQLKDVEFVGHVQGAERRKVFRMANAYLFPSYHEGLPLSVLEAMAYGIPVVTSAVGGLPDFFEDGTMGFITELRDPEQLASLLSRLISDLSLCVRIGRFNRTYARGHFAARKIAGRIEEIYALLHNGHDPAILPVG